MIFAYLVYGGRLAVSSDLTVPDERDEADETGCAACGAATGAADRAGHSDIHPNQAMAYLAGSASNLGRQPGQQK